MIGALPANKVPAMSRILRLAAAQMGPTQCVDSREAVLARLIALLEQAAGQGAQLVVFPELAFTTFFPRWLLEGAELDQYYETAMPNPSVQPLFDRAKALGADLAINTAEESLGDALCRFHGEGNRFGARFAETDVFVDCVGVEAVLQEVIAIAKYKARIAIIALYKKPASVDLFKVMANEILISGSIADDRKPEFGEALEMIAGGRQDLTPLISHRLDFSQFTDALAIARDAVQSAKVMLTFDQEPA